MFEASKRKKHVNGRNATRHRDGKKEINLKSLSRITRRLKYLFIYSEALSKNKDLKNDVKHLKIPREDFLKWLTMELDDKTIQIKYLTGKAC